MIDSGQRAAVDRHEGSVVATARRVDRACDELLAGAALALDQHVALVVAQAVDGAEQTPHLRRATDQFRRARVIFEALLELAVATQQAPPFERLLHGGANAVYVVEGLLEVVERAAADAAHGTLDAGVAGHHDDLDLGSSRV